MSKSNRILLPTDVQPKKYRLILEPDLRQFKFTGRESVDFKVNKPTNTVVLNAKEIVVKKCVCEFSGAKFEAKEISYEKEKDYVMFKFDQEIKKDGVLHLEFEGILNDKLAGFYRAKYKIKGEERFAAVTQFEPADARRAFPCWDEPAIKAVFEVTLIAPKDRVVLSNMNEISHKISGDKQIVEFAPSPIMSTYLLAFVIGEFDYVETHIEKKTIRVYTPVGKKDQGEFALEVAKRSIPLYEDYFGEKYPLPKLDLIAVPEFGSGAMENWGLITYREQCVLVDPKNTSARVKQNVALTVAHEIAHMWFGNLVTMEWWEHLWLNEGFATWVEFMAVDKLFPEWSIFEQFVDTQYDDAQQLDALVSSHPIEVEVNAAYQINEIFDDISYSKGCSVIRQLNEYMGEDKFRQGLRVYLSRFKYKNAATSDLWKALSETSGRDIYSLMEAWTKKTGYPLVTIKEESSKNNKRVVSLEQTRFFSTGPKEDPTIWPIPLSYITSANKKPVVVLFDKRKTSLTIEDDLNWVKFNPQSTGFYRIMYPPRYYSELSKAIESQELSPMDRWGIQNDVFALAKAGFLKTDIALESLKGYKNEFNYTVCSGIANNLAGVWKLIREENVADKFKKFAASLFTSQAKKLGWDKREGESQLDTLLRALTIGSLGKYDDPEIIKEAKQKWQLFLKDNSAVAPDLRVSLYSILIKNVGKQAYEEVLKIYRTTDLNEERVRCLVSLGNTEDDELIQRTLGLRNEVKDQDIYAIFRGLSTTVKGSNAAWKYFKDNFKAMKEKYESSMMINYIISDTTDGFITEEAASDIEKFFQANPLPTAKRPIEQAVEYIRARAKWIKRDKDVILKWLAKH